MLGGRRAFMDNVADRLLVLKGDGLVRLFEGNYSDVRVHSVHVYCSL